MRAFYVYVTGAVILMVIGLLSSLISEKAFFLLWLSEWRNPVADYYFYYLTKLGESYGYILFGIFLLTQSWKKMLPVPVLGGIVMLTSYTLKQFFQHERPSLYLKRIEWEGTMSILGYPSLGGYHSFPSGHSMAAWALFTLIAVMIRKTWVSIICLFLAVSVSISRVYLLAHFLQDVAAGAMIGFSLGYGVYYFYARWMKKYGEKIDPSHNQEKDVIEMN
ncbi:MAG TPA: phosphatase PAP2 family protein [Saprospiraceae bacterium]|nr:phosphatase PAP2 family protein [Saprospiraceae bacterium]